MIAAFAERFTSSKFSSASENFLLAKKNSFLSKASNPSLYSSKGLTFSLMVHKLLYLLNTIEIMQKKY